MSIEEFDFTWNGLTATLEVDTSFHDNLDPKWTDIREIDDVVFQTADDNDIPAKNFTEQTKEDIRVEAFIYWRDNLYQPPPNLAA